MVAPVPVMTATDNHFATVLVAQTDLTASGPRADIWEWCLVGAGVWCDVMSFAGMVRTSAHHQESRCGFVFRPLTARASDNSVGVRTPASRVIQEIAADNIF